MSPAKQCDGGQWLCQGGGTMGQEQVHSDRELLKGNHSGGGGHVPLAPPLFCHLC